MFRRFLFKINPEKFGYLVEFPRDDEMRRALCICIEDLRHKNGSRSFIDLHRWVYHFFLSCGPWITYRHYPSSNERIYFMNESEATDFKAIFLK